MATVICFKSESSDTYLFVADKAEYTSVDELIEGLSKEWYIGSEPLYVEDILTQDFDSRDLAKKVDILLESVESY